MKTTIEQLREILGDKNIVIPFESNLMCSKPNRCRYKIVQQKTQIKCSVQFLYQRWITLFTVKVPKAKPTKLGGLSFGLSFRNSILGELIAAHLRR